MAGFLSMQTDDERIASFSPGDTVQATVRIKEGNRERSQVFQGWVLAISGSGLAKSFTLRKIGSHGIGVERTFLVASPLLEKVEIVEKGRRARQSKLYYTRDLPQRQVRAKLKKRN
ncbi:MAG: 50S ribosomal protein L19 [Dehalococcoidia bacterium]|jgi:large subunit ribosomal protein L19|nr:50S ribosomal protein L19 [Dehalococcoidia bacterium]|tara:strand:- start:3475 stop:3822 length:348 start_codon:yes stop_codon:yes gene_type:complete